MKDYSTNLGRKKRNPKRKREQQKKGARHIKNRKNRTIENEKINRNKDWKTLKRLKVIIYC